MRPRQTVWSRGSATNWSCRLRLELAPYERSSDVLWGVVDECRALILGRFEPVIRLVLAKQQCSGSLTVDLWLIDAWRNDAFFLEGFSRCDESVTGANDHRVR